MGVGVWNCRRARECLIFWEKEHISIYIYINISIWKYQYSSHKHVCKFQEQAANVGGRNEQGELGEVRTRGYEGDPGHVKL